MTHGVAERWLLPAERAPGADRDPRLTEDGRHLVIDGRRWRATDPSIPEALRKELVRELMAARRAVGAAGPDSEAERRARARVQDAKLALGERGEPWWEEPTGDGRRRRLVAAIRALIRSRGRGKTICPSDAARAIGGEDWRELMAEARALAAELGASGEVVVTAGGNPADAVEHRGPIRLGPGPALDL